MVGPTKRHIGWTDERVAKAAKLYGEGLSCSQIAAELGGHVTRNAVIGKMTRMGVMRPTKPSRPARAVKPLDSAEQRRLAEARRAAQLAPAPPPTRRPPPAPATVGALALAEKPVFASAPATLVQPAPPPLRVVEVRDALVEPAVIWKLAPHACRYPVGEKDGSHLFCGARQQEGSSYCEAHAKLSRNGRALPKLKAPPNQIHYRRGSGTW